MLIESNELKGRIRDIAESLQSKGDEWMVGLIEVDKAITELESKGTSLDRKCGSCRWAIPFKTSVSNIKCTNPILESKRKDEIASLKQRTAPACKQYGKAKRDIYFDIGRSCDREFVRWLDGTGFSHEDYMKLCEEFEKDWGEKW